MATLPLARAMLQPASSRASAPPITARSMRLRAVSAASPPPIRRRDHRDPRRRRRSPSVVAVAAAKGEGEGEVFDGVYGPWSMEPSDFAEVWAYRACLGASALCGAAAAAEMLLLPAASSSAASPPPIPLDTLLAGGALSLGAALVLIHVYVTPLKRFVQLLWLLGVGGCAYVYFTAAGEAAAGGGDGAAATTTTAVAVLSHVASHPLWDGLFVGPLAAAATGVAVKEGFCFRRPEAAALALLLPALCLTHLLSGAWAPASSAVPFFGGGAALAAVALALGKIVQDPKGDVGDKSVFEFRKLGEAEKERVLARLRAADDAALRDEAAALERERRRALASSSSSGGGSGSGEEDGGSSDGVSAR